MGFFPKIQGQFKQNSYGQSLFVSIMIFGTYICFNPGKGMTDKPSVSGRGMPSDLPVSSMQRELPNNMTDKPSVSGQGMPSDPPVSSMQRELPNNTSTSSPSLETHVQEIALLIWFDSGYFIDDCASGAAARRQKKALRQVSAATDKRVSCCRKQDDCASGDAGRQQKRALRQVSATTDKRVSCCRRQDDDTSVTWRGARGRTETRRTVGRRCATRSGARRPSAIRSDVRGRAMTRSAARI